MGQAIKKFGWKRSDLVISTKVRPRADYEILRLTDVAQLGHGER
jgi:aryl-alcohol dehydrogenase-like predicted oxidoreductase